MGKGKFSVEEKTAYFLGRASRAGATSKEVKSVAELISKGNCDTRVSSSFENGRKPREVKKKNNGWGF